LLILLFARGGPFVDDAGLVFAAIGLAFAIFAVVPWVIERRGPRPPQWQWQPYTVAAGVNSLIACLAVPQIVRATGVLADATAIEAWFGFGGVLLIQFALYSVLDRAPAFREQVGSRAPILLGPALVVVFLGTGVFLVLEANTLVAKATLIEPECIGPRDLCWPSRTTLPALPDAAQLFVAVAAASAVAARFADWKRVSAVLMAVVFSVLVLWTADVAGTVRIGEVDLGVAGRTFAQLTFVSGVLVLLAIIAGSLFPRWPLLPESWRIARDDATRPAAFERAGTNGR
jgi:hypothetical protein